MMRGEAAFGTRHSATAQCWSTTSPPRRSDKQKPGLHCLVSWEISWEIRSLEVRLAECRLPNADCPEHREGTFAQLPQLWKPTSDRADRRILLSGMPPDRGQSSASTAASECLRLRPTIPCDHGSGRHQRRRVHRHGAPPRSCFWTYGRTTDPLGRGFG